MDLAWCGTAHVSGRVMPDQSSFDDGIKVQTAGPVHLDFTFVHKVTALPLVWLHIQFVLLIDNVVEKPVISAPWQKPSSGCCLEMLRSVLEPGARLEQHRRHARTGCALAKGTGIQMYMCAFVCHQQEHPRNLTHMTVAPTQTCCRRTFWTIYSARASSFATSICARRCSRATRIAF